MSKFSVYLAKINEAANCNNIAKSFDDVVKAAFDALDKCKEEYVNGLNGRSRAREKNLKDKNARKNLPSICEDDGEPTKQAEPQSKRQSRSNESASSNDSGPEPRASKKRNKNEVDGLLSPAQDKRLKRSASVKAQTNISKQVNVNLNQKLRRENSKDKGELTLQKHNDNGKENVQPNTMPMVQIKQEKISLPSEPEPMDTELPISTDIKRERSDGAAMPPPSAPVPRSRKGAAKEKPSAEASEDDTNGRTRTTRTMEPPAQVLRRSTRSSRVRQDSMRQDSVRHNDTHETELPEARPKRTRAKKKVSESKDGEKETQSQESVPASPTEKPRPKRTRRAQKAAEKEKPIDQEPALDKENDSTEANKTPVPMNKDMNTTKTSAVVTISQMTQKELEKYQKVPSADEILAKFKNSSVTKNKNVEDGVPKNKNIEESLTKSDKSEENLPKNKKLEETLAKNKKAEDVSSKNNSSEDSSKYRNAKNTEESSSKNKIEQTRNKNNEETSKNKNLQKQKSKEIVKDNALDETEVTSKSNEMDKTVVLPNGVYNHHNVNETVVIETSDTTDKPHTVMDATVVIDKDPKTASITDDESLLTDDSDTPATPPHKQTQPQPTSAVKEKVQQFEEMATRQTRTKTRAQAKKVEETDTQTPPDKVSTAVLSADTLTKMNSLIFNGKTQHVSSSASKPRVTPLKPSSAVKLSTQKSKEEEREDARRKKEALLEAKREQQRKKREEKMAAAAAARKEAERERQLAASAAAKERMERQAQLDQGKLDRIREIERKKQELARKVAETEERRKAEEAARQQRLVDEQKKAHAQWKKHIQEQEAAKKDAALMAKEVEQKQREYHEKLKKQRMEEKVCTPFKLPQTPPRRMEPTYMEDGFQYLNSDEEQDEHPRPAPAWSTAKARRPQLVVQAAISQSHIDKLFSVRIHSPDLREIFPGIERSRLKRTSSAVWRTPPQHTPHVQ